MLLKTSKKILYFLFLVNLISCQNDHVKLFNGKNLNGWINYGGGKFYVENECIVAEALIGLNNTFLHTQKKYNNFILEFDVKLDTLLNSGVQIRSNVYKNDTTTIRWGGRFDENGEKLTKKRKWDAGKFWGYQVEIDPSSRSWSGSVYEEGGRGFLHTPGINDKVKSAFKQLEWNHFRIIVYKDHFECWVNNIQTADIRDNLVSEGYIALQLHGIGNNKLKENKKIRWKNIILEPL